MTDRRAFSFSFGLLISHCRFARYGANPNVKNFDGVNCFELAQKNGYDDILYLLQNPDATQVAKNRDYVPPLVSGLDDM